MLREIESCMAQHPKYVRSRSQGHRLQAYSSKRGFNRLRLFIFFTCPRWIRTVPFVKTSVILYGTFLLQYNFRQMPVIPTYTRFPIAYSCVIFLAFSWSLSMSTYRCFSAVINRQYTTDTGLNIISLTKAYYPVVAWIVQL